MKTIDIGPDGMEPHIVRFGKLAPKKGAFVELGIPNEAYEMLAAKTLYTLMAPAGTDGSFANPGIAGPAGLSVSIAECPPGDGPLLHAHTQTHEIFFCLEGRFEISWGDKGQYRTVLEKFDMCNVPLGVMRAFKNVSDTTGRLMTIIQGTAKGDIAYAPEVGKAVEEKFGQPVRAAIEQHTSMRFDAGLEN